MRRGLRISIQRRRGIEIKDTPNSNIADNTTEKKEVLINAPINNIQANAPSKEYKEMLPDINIDYFNEIVRINARGIDDKLPFFITVPPVQGFFDISTLAVSKSQEVNKVYGGQRFKRSGKKYDIITVIPFRGRKWHLEKTLSTLMESSAICGKRIGFIIVENSESQIVNPNDFKYDNLHYIWINSNGFIFNKCYCHNIGAEICDSDFIHFHDCDLIVPTNFYECIINELENNDAVQCFSGRRVHYLDEINTKYYYQKGNSHNIRLGMEGLREGSPGAPGGSICLSRELFNKVGGFDPHFFWAYSIEDRFFWEKVEKFTKISTLESPKVDLYHLWHPPGWGKNPYERFEQRIFNLFISNGPGSANYIETSKNLYSELIRNHIE